MPDAALNAYLAKHYLEGAKAEAMLARAGQSSRGDGSSSGEAVPHKKRKKKSRTHESGAHSAGGSGFRMVDDEDGAWRKERADGQEEDETGAVVMPDTASAAQAQRTRWNRLGTEASTTPVGVTDDSPSVVDPAEGTAVEAAADSSTAASCGKAPKPAVRAGLKTREEMRAERLERERLAAASDRETTGEEKAVSKGQETEAERRQRERDEAQQETVYRDASGRRIDVRAEEEMQRKLREDEKRRERERQDWNKGEAQLKAAREARRQEAQMRDEGVTRYATDTRMNEELRQRDRAADPAAAFLASSSEKAKRKGPQLPAYKGSFPPNRFGIRPGYRWDGVERGNGFEAKIFQRRNERHVRQAEERAWRQEDM